MNNKLKNLEYVLRIVFYSVFVFLFLQFQFAPDDSSVEVKNETVNVTTERPTYNLSCPAPEVKAPNVTVKDYPDNIQNANLDTEISYSSDTYKVHGIDAYGELYGSSMSPSIMDGDIVLSEKYEGQELQEGMIVRYKTDDSGPIIHRIVGDYQSRRYVITSGDGFDSKQKVKLDSITHIVKGVIYN